MSEGVKGGREGWGEGGGMGGREIIAGHERHWGGNRKEGGRQVRKTWSEGRKGGKGGK